MNDRDGAKMIGANDAQHAVPYAAAAAQKLGQPVIAVAASRQRRVRNISS